MKNGKIYVAGIGPGCEDDITPAVKKAVSVSDVVVGYNYYFSFIQPFVMEGAECVDSGMRKEWDGLRWRSGMPNRVKPFVSSVPVTPESMECAFSLGDEAGKGSEIEIEVLPGISAFRKRLLCSEHLSDMILRDFAV
ncbi:MAG: hypothetical protein ACLU30_18620 [Odoribacter splanchnicus]